MSPDRYVWSGEVGWNHEPAPSSRMDEGALCSWRSSMSDTGQHTDELDVLRHSTAHVMAKAVQRLFPGSRLAIGPPIENGFYYDIDVPRPLSPEDLAGIEAEMQRIVDADEPFVRYEVP